MIDTSGSTTFSLFLTRNYLCHVLFRQCISHDRRKVFTHYRPIPRPLHARTLGEPATKPRNRKQQASTGWVIRCRHSTTTHRLPNIIKLKRGMQQEVDSSISIAQTESIECGDGKVPPIRVGEVPCLIDHLTSDLQDGGVDVGKRRQPAGDAKEAGMIFGQCWVGPEVGHSFVEDVGVILDR